MSIPKIENFLDSPALSSGNEDFDQKYARYAVQKFSDSDTSYSRDLIPSQIHEVKVPIGSSEDLTQISRFRVKNHMQVIHLDSLREKNTSASREDCFKTLLAISEYSSRETRTPAAIVQRYWFGEIKNAPNFFYENEADSFWSSCQNDLPDNLITRLKKLNKLAWDDEEQNEVSRQSLQTLRQVYRFFHPMRRPSTTITSSGNIIVEWRKNSNNLFTLECLDNSVVKYILFHRYGPTSSDVSRSSGKTTTRLLQDEVNWKVVQELIGENIE